MPEDPREKAHKISGEILRIHVSLDNYLGHLIMWYTLNFSTSRQSFFRDEILSKLSFQKRYELFIKICKIEEYNNFDKKHFLEMKKKIERIQNIRNKVAHWEGSIDDFTKQKENEKYRLWPPESLKYIDKTVVVDQILLNEIKEKYTFVAKGISRVTKYIFDKEKKEKDDFDEILLKDM